MRIIHLHHPYQLSQIDKEPVVLAMGFFDGVHIGHQAVLQRAAKKAQQEKIKLAVLTYNQHASIVFSKQSQPLKYLTPTSQKLEIFADMGVDLVYMVEFTSALAQVPPTQFVQQYMVDLHAMAVVAGFDHTFGPADIANMSTLPQLAKDRFEVLEVQPILVQGTEAASTKIRALLDAGKVELVTPILNRVYTTTGVVVHGDARGREMGFPTLNIVTPVDERLPQDGVYVVEVLVNQKWYGGMAQIGYNVTFGAGRAQTLEINLFNFTDLVYGEQVKIRWHQYLRAEVEFSGMPDLMEQLVLDQQRSEAYLNTLSD
ncbi:riboflavin biosynthesis protein RibF [Weissella coleopterorum]|uniref:Riboflavin biosynthesis protein n=1 Tax=Weissella coleopterorum TaxID=2714949 RepID=A0A6G8B1B6_9LACO|nr:riboflavin biosynthesis protein RibF [Weissella coleopterorum]QIL50923.1 riboflavin biosynthesis protein RibF [Weissella coleopterorum]